MRHTDNDVGKRVRARASGVHALLALAMALVLVQAVALAKGFVPAQALAEVQEGSGSTLEGEDEVLSAGEEQIDALDEAAATDGEEDEELASPEPADAAEEDDGIVADAESDDDEIMSDDATAPVADPSDAGAPEGQAPSAPRTTDPAGDEDDAQLFTTDSRILNHTKAEAMDWVRSKLNQWLQQPNGYGGQCVDLVGCYLQYLGTDIIWGNANQYSYASLPSGVTRIQGAQPQEGDILVFTGGTYGHVAIYESDYVTYHQNYLVQYVTRQTMYYRNAASGYWGVIRPNFKSPAPVRTIPGRILNRSNVSVADGDFVIRSAIGNKVLTIGGGVHGQNGANAQLWTGNAFDNSVFRIDWNGDGQRITLKSSGKVLDTYGNPWDATVANVQQWDDKNESEQRWIFQDAGDGWVYIRNLNGYYLDVQNGWDSNYNGGNVQAWDANESDAQKWKLERQIPGDILPNRNMSVDAGYYVIRSMIGNRVLDIDASRLTQNGANAQLWIPSGTNNQMFYISWNGSGYRIKPKGANKVLEVSGNADVATLGNAQQWDDNKDPDQRWIFQDAGDGWVYIRNLNGFYLDVQNGWDSNRNGGNVQTWVANGSDAQKWKLTRVSGSPKVRIADGDYLIRSAVGVRLLDIDGASTAMRANLRIWSPSCTASQIFRIGWNDTVKANSIRLAQRGNENRWLDKDGGDGVGNVFQWEGNGGYGQNWFFEDAGGGWYYIRNIYGYYLDVTDAKNADGTNVWCCTFNGSNAQKWRLEGRTLAYASVAHIGAKTRTGSAITPKPLVTWGGKTLRFGTDYTLAYANNVNAGTAAVTIRGKGSYTGSKVVTFTIARAAQIVTAQNKRVAVGKSVALGATASGGGKLSYQSSNDAVATVSTEGVVTGKKVGTAQITITAAKTSQHSSATTTVTVRVLVANPIAAKAKKATVAASLKTLRSKSVTLASNVKVSGARGAVSYANASTNATTKKFKVNASTGKLTIPKGTKKGTYQVRVKVLAKGDSTHLAGSKTVSFNVRVR